MKRPVGITILAVLAIIYGIFSLLLTLLGLLGTGLAVSGVGHVKYAVGTLVYATISDAVLGILYLTFGIGAFQLQDWAWTTGVVALVLTIVRSIVDVVRQGFSASSIVSASIYLVIALVLLWYLFRPNIRAAFRKAAAA
jgi:hypothetical protein